jgi:hypothetical protein
LQLVIFPAPHFFPSVPSEDPAPGSLLLIRLGVLTVRLGKLTVVALGLGGLALPFLPVLLSLFISDFSFCSLIGKNKHRPSQASYQSIQNIVTHMNQVVMKQNRGGGDKGAPLLSLVRSGFNSES